MAVGNPEGTHFVYDNGLGVISCVWRGDFVDASPMWINRGDGSFRPRGDVIFVDNSPQIGKLKDGAFISNVKDFKSKGYSLDKDTRNPTFHYFVGESEIYDEVYVTKDGNSLTRRLRFEDVPEDGYLRLASGSEIKKLNNETFLIDGKMYLSFSKADSCTIKSTNDGQDLILKIDDLEIKYSLIW